MVCKALFYALFCCLCELQLRDSRRIVEEAVFDRLGRPIFLDAGVEVVMLRIAARVEGPTETARSEACATGAPREDRIPELAQEEAVRLKREIEVRSLKLEFWNYKQHS